MLNIPQRLADELRLQRSYVDNVLALLDDGGTIPFIARYRKEQTGNLNEVTLRTLEERYRYLRDLEERKRSVLKSIAKQGKLTPELQGRIESCLQKTELEDLYLPFKPKKRTRATVAKERGLLPLARWLKAHNTPRVTQIDLEAEANHYLCVEKGVKDAACALQGAADILAEEVSEKAELRAFIRNFIYRNGAFKANVKKAFAPGTTKFENYREFSAPVRHIHAHNVLALKRGESAGVLTVGIEFDEAAVLAFLEGREVHARAQPLRDFYHRMLKDAFDRLLKPSLITEVLKLKEAEADGESIQTFAANLRQLLLSSPAGGKPTLGIDPGFRTGCKVVAVDGTGRFLEHQTIYPHSGDAKRKAAQHALGALIAKHSIALIAIGNGTAGRETDLFVHEVLETLEGHKPVKVMVSEAGASVYSASETAAEEFAELDVTVRGAISIARRLQDPLAELVKIEPKSIGVGQYQHDVDQKQLKQKLSETVESCVNFVGVDLNTASKELLRYVAGVSPAVAQNVVAHRNAHGPFNNRNELLSVPRFGPKTFEQASGFLRIRNGDNPLDATGVHPESYPVVEAIAQDLGLSVAELTRMPQRLDAVDVTRYLSDTTGAYTLEDILDELKKPGRDPRQTFCYARFKPDITSIEDLKQGMVLEGVVTNITNFGAFVDIGVHENGLVHISQMSDQFVKDPTQVVKVGQVVKVQVLEVNLTLKRIGLSLRLGQDAPDGGQLRSQN